MEASVNAFHPPRLSFSSPFLPSPYVPTSAISVLLASRRGHHPRSVHSLDAHAGHADRENDVSEKGSIDPMENLRGARKGREAEREREREWARRRRVYRGAQPVANSQRDYRRRITAIPRPNTNWSLGTAARSGSNGGERRRGGGPCMHGASVYRCDGSSE